MVLNFQSFLLPSKLYNPGSNFHETESFSFHPTNRKIIFSLHPLSCLHKKFTSKKETHSLIKQKVLTNLIKKLTIFQRLYNKKKRNTEIEVKFLYNDIAWQNTLN